VQRARHRVKGQSELLCTLDSNGQPLPRGVSRREAHTLGIWHRALSVFVINEYGEVLLEKRSLNKDLFPGFFDVPGGHVEFGASSIETAHRELKEELEIDFSPTRLIPLCAEGAVVERVIAPELQIVNLERKTIYLLEITDEEERAILFRASEYSKLSAEELSRRGVCGEVSHVEFWEWERLLNVADKRKGRVIASGTESSLANNEVRERIRGACLEKRQSKRLRFWMMYGQLFGGAATFDDQSLCDTLLQPLPLAHIEEVAAVFEDGVNQVAGSYTIGDFRRKIAGDDYWSAKLRDPETSYVWHLVAAIAYGQPAERAKALLDQVGSIQRFVSAALNIPLSGGQRLRDNLGNLADIAAGRNAVLCWLRYYYGEPSSTVALDEPLRSFVSACLKAGRDLLTEVIQDRAGTKYERLRMLVLTSLAAASVDFNNPQVQDQLRTGVEGWILSYVRSRIQTTLSDDLGGNTFLEQFYSEFADDRHVVLAYFPGNSVQAFLSLAICEELLKENHRLHILFIPKSGAPGSDFTLQRAEEILNEESCGLFQLLGLYLEEGRFRIVQNGPSSHGLDPGRMSPEVAEALGKASVVFAEGQSYAEIRGWKKPAYVAFRVNGRVSEALNGVSRLRGACAVVRLTPGIEHFEGFETALSRKMTDPVNGHLFPCARQTTVEYVAAVLSQNFSSVVERIFHGESTEACLAFRSEARKLNKTFSQLVLGSASAPPSPAEVDSYFASRSYPVFGCGGGGGFNGVTLKAVKKLELSIVAGVPSTDDGGNSGQLQKYLQPPRGFVFGVGDMAAILQEFTPNLGKQAVLAYRFEEQPSDLVTAVLERIIQEVNAPTYERSSLGGVPDFLSFVCDQLNFARIVERRLRCLDSARSFPVKGSSIRNLNVLASYELCNALGDASVEANRLAALYVLKKALAIEYDLMVLPVTNEQCSLYVDYAEPIPAKLLSDFEIPSTAVANNGRRLIGQRYIDKLPHTSPRLGAGVIGVHSKRPRANSEYLHRLSRAKLFIMGAGSLFSSQLAQLAVGGVVDILLTHRDMRRVLVLNHVKMDETIGMTVTDHIAMIEKVATENASSEVLSQVELGDGRIRIGDLFTDVVVPRTVAREIEQEIERVCFTAAHEAAEIELTHASWNRSVVVRRNLYIDFLVHNPDTIHRLDITAREVEVLSYLERSVGGERGRKEAGRYRGALFAVDADVIYLTKRGVQRRNIHEIDSIGENWKLVKAEGAPSFEFFPGLVPEALMGIIRIALERGADSLAAPVL